MVGGRQPAVGTLDELGDALAEVAALATAGLDGAAVWRPVLGDRTQVDPAAVGEALGQWCDGLAAQGRAAADVARFATAVVAAQRVAGEVGGSLTGLLRGLGEAIRAAQEAQDQLEAALAGPKASARLLQFLPLLGIALGMAMGANPLGVLVGGGLGTVALGVGLGLLLVGRLWTGRLLARAGGSRGRGVAGDGARLLDGEVAAGLLAGCLAAGLSLPAALDAAGRVWPGPAGRALARAGAALARGEPWAAAWAGPDRAAPGVAGIERCLELAWHSGVEAGPLLEGVRQSLARQARRAAAQANAKLGVTLMLPLGLCYLPAFVAVGLVPVMLSVATNLAY
ncbi:MAG: type II secretion system F family protein [Bifidobacteriaceae bacterium]|jgi:tight adherence protein B|nr:type II secretion system F family protein [Bifidobacteriaceae bacterium]